MILLWEIDTPVEPELLSLMQTAADCALWAEGVRLPCAVSVRLCGDEAIREINRDYRQTDRATDVLSFPTVNYPKGITAGRAGRLIRRELDDQLDACMLGDIVISMDHVRAQAREYGHSEQREYGYLLTHGLFHLMGYDHVKEEDRPAMRAMEEKTLARVGLTREE